MGFVIFIIIFSLVVLIALVVVFVLFLVKGSKGAKKDRELFEKGMITQEEFDSGYNQGTKKVVQDNYAEFRRQDREQQREERRQEMLKNKGE